MRAGTFLVGLYLGAGVLLTLFGLTSVWLMGREVTNRREAARAELRLGRMENALWAAAAAARGGDREAAGREASGFFSALRREVDRGRKSTLTDEERAGLRPLLYARDEVVTQLARGDPAGTDRLTELYMAYRRVMSGRVQRQGKTGGAVSVATR